MLRTLRTGRSLNSQRSLQLHTGFVNTAANMALTIGVNVNQQVNRSAKGSEMDGYVGNVAISEDYAIRNVAACGFRTREMHVERF